MSPTPAATAARPRVEAFIDDLHPFPPSLGASRDPRIRAMLEAIRRVLDPSPGFAEDLDIGIGFQTGLDRADDRHSRLDLRLSVGEARPITGPRQVTLTARLVIGSDDVSTRQSMPVGSIDDIRTAVERLWSDVVVARESDSLRTPTALDGRLERFRAIDAVQAARLGAWSIRLMQKWRRDPTRTDPLYDEIAARLETDEDVARVRATLERLRGQLRRRTIIPRYPPGSWLELERLEFPLLTTVGHLVGIVAHDWISPKPRIVTPVAVLKALLLLLARNLPDEDGILSRGALPPGGLLRVVGALPFLARHRPRP